MSTYGGSPELLPTVMDVFSLLASTERERERNGGGTLLSGRKRKNVFGFCDF